MKKGSVLQLHITTLNAHAPNIRICQAKTDKIVKRKKSVVIETSTSLCQYC